MADQANLRAAHALFDAWAAGDLDQMNAYESEDHVSERSGAPGVMNRQQLRAYLQNFLTAFPGTHFDLWLTVAEGEYVVDHWSIEGTHQGVLYGPSGDPIPPTGKHVVVKGTQTVQVKNGKVVRSWGYFDLASLMAQLGLVPEM